MACARSGFCAHSATSRRAESTDAIEVPQAPAPSTAMRAMCGSIAPDQRGLQVALDAVGVPHAQPAAGHLLDELERHLLGSDEGDRRAVLGPRMRLGRFRGHYDRVALAEPGLLDPRQRAGVIAHLCPALGLRDQLERIILGDYVERRGLAPRRVVEKRAPPANAALFAGGLPSRHRNSSAEHT